MAGPTLDDDGLDLEVSLGDGHGERGIDLTGTEE